MEPDDRIARAILTAGVLTAMAAGNTATVDDVHRLHVIKSVKAWVEELERALFPPDR